MKVGSSASILFFILAILCTPNANAQAAPEKQKIICDHAAPPRGMHYVCKSQCDCHLEGTLKDGEGGVSPAPPTTVDEQTSAMLEVQDENASPKSQMNLTLKLPRNVKAQAALYIKPASNAPNSDLDPNVYFAPFDLVTGKELGSKRWLLKQPRRGPILLSPAKLLWMRAISSAWYFEPFSQLHLTAGTYKLWVEIRDSKDRKIAVSNDISVTILK